MIEVTRYEIMENLWGLSILSKIEKLIKRELNDKELKNIILFCLRDSEFKFDDFGDLIDTLNLEIDDKLYNKIENKKLV